MPATFLISFAIAAIGPAPAPAPTTAQPQTRTAANSNRGARNGDVSANGDLNEMICRSSPPPLGSRLGHRRICMTRAQWLEQNQTQATQREALERTQRQLYDSRGD